MATNVIVFLFAFNTGNKVYLNRNQPNLITPEVSLLAFFGKILIEKITP